MSKITENSGFTLIETLIAMAVFSIGILSLYGMQMAAVKENVTANSITTASNWGQGGVEELLADEYENLADGAGTTDGCGGLSDWPTSDGTFTGDAVYSLYWNVADDCSLTSIPHTANPADEQRPKHVRVIVTRKIGSLEKEYVVLNYIKQNTI